MKLLLDTHIFLTLVELAKLPTIHRDPFDRIIIAQARQQGLKLVSVDPIVKSYPVDLL